MPESNLAATWDECRQRVAFDRGWDLDLTSWDDSQNFILETCLRDGARFFYKPGPNGGPPHEWSFLKPVKELVIPDATEDVDLWPDFGFLVGDLYFLDPDVSYAQPLTMKNDGQILKIRQQCPSTSARPEFGAIVPHTNPGVFKGQRFKLLVHPTPDQEYTVQGRYSVIPGALDISHQHPYGGAAHAQTLIYACLKASEVLNGTPGPHTARFAECLAASIEHDRRVQAQSIDNSDSHMRPLREYPYVRLTTYNGQYTEA